MGSRQVLLLKNRLSLFLRRQDLNDFSVPRPVSSQGHDLLSLFFNFNGHCPYVRLLKQFTTTPGRTACLCTCEGDKKAEEEVDECLLIPFRHCLRWNIDEHSTSSQKQHQHQYQTVAMDVTQVLKITFFTPRALRSMNIDDRRPASQFGKKLKWS